MALKKESIEKFLSAKSKIIMYSNVILLFISILTYFLVYTNKNLLLFISGYIILTFIIMIIIALAFNFDMLKNKKFDSKIRKSIIILLLVFGSYALIRAIIHFLN